MSATAQKVIISHEEGPCFEY